jgi:hypothetical protein
MTNNNYDQYFTKSKEGFHQSENYNLFNNENNNLINLSFFPIETYNEGKNSEDFPISENQDSSLNSFYENVNYNENPLYYNINKEKRNKISIKNLFQLNNILYNKRGRPNKSNLKKNSRKIHNKFTSDNLRRKIHIHFLNFIISFLNEILSYSGYEDQFYKLDYNRNIKNVNKAFFNKLKNKNIGEIISEKISSKFKNKEKDFNFFFFQKLKNDKILNKLFSQSYFLIFKVFYFPSKKKINLKEYGLNVEISLSEDVKMYSDLLERFEDNDYKRAIINYTKKNFLVNSLFRTK